MWFLLDLIVVAIVALFIFISMRKGFVCTLIEMLGFVIAIILANIVSTPLANLTYDKAIEPAIISSVQESQNEGVESASDTALNAMPSFVKNIVGLENATSAFQNEVSDNINDGTEAAVKIASQNVIKPKITRYISMFYIMILTTVFIFLVGFLAKFVNKLFSFSVVGKVNKILGGVLGCGKGLFIAMVFCTVISLLVSFSNGSFLFFTKSAIDDSLLFNLLCISVSI